MKGTPLQIRFYDKNLAYGYLLAEFEIIHVINAPTGESWAHCSRGSINVMPDEVTIRVRWPKISRGGFFSNCPNDLESAQKANDWVMRKYTEWKGAR